MPARNHNTSQFDPQGRLDALPSLSTTDRLDELLAEHFGFVPKTFTGHLFNLINDAAYDTVDAVEEAIRGSFDPEDPNSPNKDDIAKSLNSLETLLCCSTDNQFDLVEIWLHRNIFVFPSHLTEALLDHFKLDHTKLWDHLFPQERIATEECPYLEPDWERTKAEESETWNQLEQAKQEHLQVTDDHSSLLAVSKALDRKLAGLKAVSAQLDLLSSESIRSYDPNTKRLINLNSQAESISQLFHQLTQLQSKRQDLIKPYTFSTSNQHPLDSVTLPVTVKYEHLINDLAMSKVDDLVAELGEKAGADTEVDENLTEVMNHLALKGKSNRR